MMCASTYNNAVTQQDLDNLQMAIDQSKANLEHYEDMVNETIAELEVKTPHLQQTIISLDQLQSILSQCDGANCPGYYPRDQLENDIMYTTAQMNVLKGELKNLESRLSMNEQTRTKYQNELFNKMQAYDQMLNQYTTEQEALVIETIPADEPTEVFPDIDIAMDDLTDFEPVPNDEVILEMTPPGNYVKIEKPNFTVQRIVIGTVAVGVVGLLIYKIIK